MIDIRAATLMGLSESGGNGQETAPHICALTLTLTLNDAFRDILAPFLVNDGKRN